ncbi:hypothetical protein LS73_002300 [Helicobacter muridarum]|uniref:Predicted exporter n=1 Tax=Helicobacter muridarum TaxID=216 RepID=A0A099U0X4_9HELI|nr:hypothetical protein [Helicobacter muridarum]TLE01126.1 hypothetical protein LS73_002300 [Helicobacter muridarum]STQ85993.1 Predicted exporter [Helicobacter muridarum]
MIRFVNIFFLIFSLSLLFLFFKQDKITISQEVLDLFPTTHDREIVDIYQKFSNSRFVLVAIKGFTQESSNKLDSFLAEISKLENVSSTKRYIKITNKLQDFVTKYYYLVATPNIESKTKLAPVLTQAQVLDYLQVGLKTLEENHINTDSVKNDNINNSTKNPNNIFNPIDPLGLFKLNNSISSELIIKDYGYLALVELKSLENNTINETLDNFNKIASGYQDIRFFSPYFMNVQNLSLILKEVTYLSSFASIIFIIFYFVIIRIYTLTINTVCTLIFSNTIATIIVAIAYPKVTIMAISFGMGISGIAIDYMMHHNFFSIYAKKQPVFNKPVFYGYITTVIGFGTCLFVPFPLLSQLALHAIISLSISYVFFAFIYPRIGFSEPRLFKSIISLRKPIISSYLLLGISIIFLVICIPNIKIDFDISKLDYQNKKMLEERDFFDTKQREENPNILISSSSVDGLISLSKILQKEFESKYIKISDEDSLKPMIPLSIIPTKLQIDENLRFLDSKQMQQNKLILKAVLPKIKKQMAKPQNIATNDINSVFDIMESSYENPNIPNIDVNVLTDLGFNVIAENIGDSSMYYYLVSIPKAYMPIAQEVMSYIKNPNIKQIDSITPKEKELITTQSMNIEMRSLQNIIKSITEEIYEPMLTVFGIAFCLMTLTLIWTAKRSFIDSYVFILFPLSSSLLIMSTHSELNLMHLFALLILVVVSVDYGIYSIKEVNNIRTTHAIFFSSITTGISFGILVISKTKALNSFGEIIFIGMACIIIMLVFHKPLNNQTSF